MGGQRCIAFGCKSGHKRGVSKKEKEKQEKVHFFQVPKVDTELWQHALLRKDIVIKPGQSVCEKHFPKEDLLWRKELKAPDGRILGVSADYKIPKLRKGSLPSLFLGITPEVKHKEASDSVTNESHLKNEEMDISASDNIDEKQNEVEMGNHMPIELTLEIPDEIEETPLFEIIYNNEKSVALPLGWCRQNMKYAGKRLVHFCQFVPRMENEIIQPICTKQVLVDENLETNILIMRQPIEKKKSDENKEPFSSLEDLEHLLKIVNSWKLCSGLSISSNNEVQASFVRRDKEGVLRNVQCSLYMPGISRSGCCEECKRSRRTISRKVSRMKNESDLHRLRVNLNTQQRRKLDEMRQEMRTLRRGRERALARISLLKDLRVRDLQAYKASQKTLEQLLNESSLDGNQQLVVWEMLSASKQTHSKARRYSRVWISFCLTLHKKSPVTYRFLRQNNILPLPAPRTVLRFAQFNPSVNQNVSQLDVKEDAIKDAATEKVTFKSEIIPEEEIPNVVMETEVS